MVSSETADKLEDIEFQTKEDCHELSVQRQYFNKIRDGSKTVEGRAGKIEAKNNILENYAKGETRFKVGDKLRFTISGDTNRSEKNTVDQSVTCRITKVVFHDTFKDMLAGDGLEKCLPGVSSVEEGVQIYRSFSGYRQRELEFGVVGIHLEVLSGT